MFAKIGDQFNLTCVILASIPFIYLHSIFEIHQFEISSLMNWIFTACVACKNLVQTRKIQFIKLEIQAGECHINMYMYFSVKNQVQIDRRIALFEAYEWIRTDFG